PMNASRWLLFGIAAVVCACGTQGTPQEAPAESAHQADTTHAEHAPAANPPAAPPIVETGPGAAPAAAAEPVAERFHPTEDSGIDPEADTIARAMCDALRDAKRFSFHAETTMERLLSNGSMVEIPASMQITVRRPDGIRVDRMSVKGHRVLQYDGKELG